jgi:hypothetical protein
MPQINNLENNVLLEICLINNSLLDVELSRNDIENWIPFTFLLKVLDEKYVYADKDGATFTLCEIKNFISGVQKLINLKKSNPTYTQIEFFKSEEFVFFNLEANFGIIVYDPFDENELGIKVWINIGTYSKGKIVGFDKGYDFVVSLNSVENFINELNQQLNILLKRAI